MKELFDEYGGMVCVCLLGLGYLSGFALIFDAILSGWHV